MEAARVKAESIIHEGLETALNGLTINGTCRVRARLARLRRDLRLPLGAFLEGVEGRYIALKESESAAARQIVGELVGNDKQLSSGVRLQLLLRTAAAAPMGFFPFRTFMGLLALTAGALDRVLFALTGSIPSLAMTALQTAKNLQQLQGMRERARVALRERAHQLANSHLAASHEVFLRATEQALPESARVRLRKVGSTSTIQGLDELERNSAEIFEQRLSTHLSARISVWIPGLIATALFLGLLAGPAWAVYREYFSAWNATFAQYQSGLWQNYPAPSAGMLFSTLLLVVAPAFGLAAVTLSLSITGDRVHRCVEAIRRDHHLVIDRMLGEQRIYLSTDDPVRQAVRTLLEYCRPPERSLEESGR